MNKKIQEEFLKWIQTITLVNLIAFIPISWLLKIPLLNKIALTTMGVAGIMGLFITAQYSYEEGKKENE